MYLILNLFIFIMVLFFYIHINFYLTTSNYLEIYEIENITKDSFEELCNLKQPLVLRNFEINNNQLLNDLNVENLINNYSSFDIKIFNKINYEIPINLEFSKAFDLFEKDCSLNYISEFNYDFLEETSLSKIYSSIDNFFRPYNVSKIEYDLLLGSSCSYTKLKYTLYSRNIFYINSGSVELTLTIPNSKKYLHIDKLDNSLDYFSKIDIYNVEDIYLRDFNKVKFMKVILNKGDLFFLPGYWFYSINFLENKTTILNFKYNTYFSSLSIFPEIFKNFLQNHNIKNNYLKKIE